MFDISLDGETTFWPDMNCIGMVGKIRLGNFAEPFVAPLMYWGVDDYRHHWRAAIAHLLEEDQPTCLITEIFGTDEDDMIQWWLLYPDGIEIIAQQQLTDLASFSPPFSPSEPWRSIPPRNPQDKGELVPSEWRIDRESVVNWYVRAR
jgi:hypothetical protein